MPGLTLDTVSIVVTQYPGRNGTNGTAITGTTTIHGDVRTLNASTISAAQSYASSILRNQQNADYADPTYVLASGTDGNLGNGISIPYPTPYIGIAGFGYSTIIKSSPPQCPPNFQPNINQFPQVSEDHTCVCEMTEYNVQNFHDEEYATSSIITVSETYYQPLRSVAAGELGYMGDSANIQPYNNVSFSAWLMSNLSLRSAMPQLSSCFYLPVIFGPPAVKIPVSALTGTTTTTVQGIAQTSNTPAPASSFPVTIAPQTIIAPSPAPSPKQEHTSSSHYAAVPAPKQSLENPTPKLPDPKNPSPESSGSENAPPNDSPPSYQSQFSPTKEYSVPAPKQTLETPTPKQPKPENPSPASPSTEIHNLKVIPPSNPSASSLPEGNTVAAEGADEQLPPTLSATEHPPAISFAGSLIEPDDHKYELPGIGEITAGGPPVITNKIVYSLAPSATALVSNGIALPLTPVSALPFTGSKVTPVLNFGGSTYTPDLSSNYIVAGQTIKPGSAAVVIADTLVSIASGGNVAVIGTSTRQLVPLAFPQVTPVLTFDGSVYTANTATQFIIASQTLTRGGKINVDGTPIAFISDGSAFVLGTNTHMIKNAAVEQTGAALTFDGTTYTENSASQYIVAGQTLTQGGAITISSTPIFLASNGKVAVIGSSTQQLAIPDTTQAPVLTFKGSTYTAVSSKFVIAGQTLTQGEAITVSGTPISLAPNGQAAVIGSSTQQLHFPGITGAPVITFKGSTYTASSSKFIIAGQTLTPSGVITVSGTPISLPATASDIVIIGTSTQEISTAVVDVAGEPIITVEGSAYTANSVSEFVIEGKTLTKGGIVTVNGTPISYAAAGTDVVVGTSTEAVIGIGGLIISGFGYPSSKGNAEPTAFTGSATSNRGLMHWECLLTAAGIFELWIFGWMI